MARFCTNCGKPVQEGTKFCMECGTNLEYPSPEAPATNAAAPVDSPLSYRTEAATPRPGQASPQHKKGSGCGKKAAVIVLIVAVLLITAGVCGSVYVYRAYQAKKQAAQVKKAKETINTSGLLDLLSTAVKNQGENDENDEDEAIDAGGLLGLLKMAGINPGGNVAEEMPTYPDWSGRSSSPALPPAATAPLASSAGEGGKTEIIMGQTLPMRKGLRIITAVQDIKGDYESIKEIRSASDDGVLLDYSSLNDPQATGTEKRSTRTRRKVLIADLQSSHEYAQGFSESQPLTLPGTTALGISSATFDELMKKGESEFTYQEPGLKGSLSSGLTGMLGGIMEMAEAGALSKDKATQKAMKDLRDMGKVNCMLTRVDRKIYSFPVLLNNERVQLPAIRANCESDDGKLAEFYFLNDRQNPLSLTWRLSDNDRLQVVKLEYTEYAEDADAKAKGAPAASVATKQLEQKLQKQGKVDIYGIYFDFASAEIQPQSDQTLNEIAAVMNENPNWKLNIGGHTDNIGGDAANMQLSRQRAEAVKQALVARYNISADRLTTAGYGASSPVETNDTMEGRARNRRVELSRQ